MALWAGQLDEWTAGKVAERFVRQGLGADYDQRDLRQAISDMNQRIRYAASEHDNPATVNTAAAVTDQVPAPKVRIFPLSFFLAA